MRELTPNEVNELYDSWLVSQCPILYSKLLQAVMDSAYARFIGEGRDAAEAISLMLAAKVFRALPGYSGPKPLKPYDPSRGKFYGFVSTMGRTTRLDYKRKQAKEKHIVYSGSSTDIENIYARSQDPWRSEGRKRQKKLPPA